MLTKTPFATAPATKQPFVLAEARLLSHIRRKWATRIAYSGVRPVDLELRRAWQHCLAETGCYVRVGRRVLRELGLTALASRPPDPRGWAAPSRSTQ